MNNSEKWKVVRKVIKCFKVQRININLWLNPELTLSNGNERINSEMKNSDDILAIYSNNLLHAFADKNSYSFQSWFPVEVFYCELDQSSLFFCGENEFPNEFKMLSSCLSNYLNYWITLKINHNWESQLTIMVIGNVFSSAIIIKIQWQLMKQNFTFPLFAFFGYIQSLSKVTKYHEIGSKLQFKGELNERCNWLGRTRRSRKKASHIIPSSMFLCFSSTHQAIIDRK